MVHLGRNAQRLMSWEVEEKLQHREHEISCSFVCVMKAYRERGDDWFARKLAENFKAWGMRTYQGLEVLEGRQASVAVDALVKWYRVEISVWMFRLLGFTRVGRHYLLDYSWFNVLRLSREGIGRITVKVGGWAALAAHLSPSLLRRPSSLWLTKALCCLS